MLCYLFIMCVACLVCLVVLFVWFFSGLCLGCCFLVFDFTLCFELLDYYYGGLLFCVALC